MTLEGYYSIDTYGKDGTLKSSTVPEKNFITSTGLNYIGQFAIADCFRYISLGTSSVKNIITDTDGEYGGTRYLDSPDSNYMYIGGRTAETKASSQYLSAGFKEMESGVRLSRSWRIPVGDGNYFKTATTYKEVMLSPGKGETTVIDSSNIKFGPTTCNSSFLDEVGTNYVKFSQDNNLTTYNQFIGKFIRIDGPDITNTVVTQLSLIIPGPTNITDIKRIYFTPISIPAPPVVDNYTFTIYQAKNLCHYTESVEGVGTDVLTNGFTTRNGKEYASSSIYYTEQASSDSSRKSICSASGAFVRIVKDIPVSVDDYMVFNYNLDVGFETGLVPFSINMSGTSRNTRTTYSTNWNSKILGGHQLIHAGIKLINNGNLSSLNLSQDGVASASYNYDAEYGESFIPNWGCPLEPSARYTSLSAYLTNDNLQYLANSLEGGASSNAGDGFYHTSGLMRWRKELYSSSPGTTQLGIRKAPPTATISTARWPAQANYNQSLTYNEMIATGFRCQSLLSSSDVAISDNFSGNSSRTRIKTKSYEFLPNNDADPFAGNINAGIAAAQIRGFVLAYKDPLDTESETLIPYLDCLFKDSGSGFLESSQKMIPSQDIPVDDQYTTGIIPVMGVPWPVGTISGSYWNYLEEGSKLSFSFLHSWGSPCSSSVTNCPP